MDIKMKLDPQKMGDIALRVVADVRAAAGELQGAAGIGGLFKAADKVVAAVEDIGAELQLLGSDKKEIAVAAICLLVPDQWAPDWLVALIAGWAIERALPALQAGPAPDARGG